MFYSYPRHFPPYMYDIKAIFFKKGLGIYFGGGNLCNEKFGFVINLKNPRSIDIKKYE